MIEHEGRLYKKDEVRGWMVVHEGGWYIKEVWGEGADG